ncbi:uncharacterized protein Dwil_GK16989 [Drosophila willistoni]|uniref:MADF domain-containing protein n=1 Tax=Drosophila willistoni TaxID=7260 RepID=B4MKU2_DROWI|nr:uncharacterized protein LOC6638900 [Drosophila willistoni]EDW72798.1 uncharacterized protein Dwil_GK16989 [Drosophila willistoni]
MRTSYKKNRPFDFKLIDLVQPNKVLYMRTGLSNYETMKTKTEIWAKIAKIMNCEVDFCIMRWNNLHYQFRKEFRRASQTGSTWPYLQRLQFLADLQLRSKRQKKPLSEAHQEMAMATIEEPPMEHLLWNAEQQNNFVVEEIIEDTSNDQIIHEEIIYEEDENQQEYMYPSTDFLQIDKILAQFQKPHRVRVERRIMAFLLKCQLRSLVNESIDDLTI